MNKNVPVYGLLLGLLFPILGLIVTYLIKFSGAGFGDFIQVLVNDHKAAALMLAFSLFANLIPFIYFTNKRLDQTAKGVLIATMLYALLIILLKYVWR
jgi:zinc transporter ZupT